MTVRLRAAIVAAMALCGLSLANPVTQVRAAEIPATAVSIMPHNASIDATVPSLPALPTPTAPDIVAAPIPQPAAPVYSSLAQAVAATVIPETGSEDLGCLAGAIYFEAKGEPLDGQLAIADVILNRSRSGRFPADICSVVTQRGQFSFVRGGRVPDVDHGVAGYRTALKVAQIALAKAWKSTAAASQALFFHSRREGVGRGATAITAIGNHLFYR